MTRFHKKPASRWMPIVVIGVLGGVSLFISQVKEPVGQTAGPATVTHLGVPVTDMVITEPLFVDPGDTMTVLTVPPGQTFVVTDVVVYPNVDASSNDFLASYMIRDMDRVRFQYRLVGTNANWSQHFSGGIPFSSGSVVSVGVEYFTKGRVYFQIMGYYTTP